MFETMEQAQAHFNAIGQKDAHITATLKAEGDTGEVEAAFSIFDELDTDGDVVLSSAFKDGQEVGMVWGHQWGSRPIGKGTIHVEDGRAVLKGKFFTDTFDGQEAYKTVKNMGDLQEWSWGFKVLDADIVEDEDSPFGYKRIIKETEVYEVSPVFIGANRNTSTLSLKANSAAFKELVRAEITAIVPIIVEKVLSELHNSEEDDSIVEEKENEETQSVLDEAVRVAAQYEFMRYEGGNY